MNRSQYGDNRFAAMCRSVHCWVGRIGDILFSPGSRSFVFGIHSVVWHSYYVMKAWRMMGWKLTGMDVLAILLHDVGYIGLWDLGKKGSRRHVMLGSVLMRRLGYPHRRMILHSSAIAHANGKTMSRMGIADKLSMALENSYFYALRAWLAVEQEYYYDVGEERIPGEDGSFMGLVRFHKRASRAAIRKALEDYWKRIALGKELDTANRRKMEKLINRAYLIKVVRYRFGKW